MPLRKELESKPCKKEAWRPSAKDYYARNGQTNYHRHDIEALDWAVSSFSHVLTACDRQMTFDGPERCTFCQSSHTGHRSGAPYRLQGIIRLRSQREDQRVSRHSHRVFFRLQLSQALFKAGGKDAECIGAHRVDLCR